MADPVSARMRALIDGALQRVFDEPFDVRTGEELEKLVAAGPAEGPSAGGGVRQLRHHRGDLPRGVVRSGRDGVMTLLLITSL